MPDNRSCASHAAEKYIDIHLKPGVIQNGLRLWLSLLSERKRPLSRAFGRTILDFALPQLLNMLFPDPHSMAWPVRPCAVLPRRRGDSARDIDKASV